MEDLQLKEPLQQVPNLTIEDVCSVAGKLEMVMYPAGAGGDFFCNLFAMAHRDTLRNMVPESFDKNGKRYHGNIPSYWNELPEFGQEILRYKPPNYIHSPIILLKTVEETMGWFSKSHPYPETVKHILYTSILNYTRGLRIYPRNDAGLVTKEEWIQTMREKLGRILILNPTHQNHFATKEPTSNRVWTTLNITPKTKEGVGVCNLGHQVLFNRRRHQQPDWDRLEGRGDKHFPFMDYMVVQNFDAIINFGLRHYSKDLHIPFMRRELEIYYKHRVGPLLERFNQGWETGEGEMLTIRKDEAKKRSDVQHNPFNITVDNQK